MQNLLFPPTPQEKVLRPYQQTAIDLILASARQGHTRIVCQLPTGAGKTLIASRLVKSSRKKGNRVLFVAPSISLINQTVAAFEAECLTDIGVMQANHPRTNAAAMIQVATCQTLARRKSVEADLVIVDECHQRAKVTEEMMRQQPNVHFIGLTATPGAKGMGNLWEDLVVPCTINDLIGWRYLSQFTVYAPDNPDLTGVKIRNGDYHTEQTQKVMSKPTILASVVQTWLARGENRPTFVFAVSCPHARKLHEEFESAGVASLYIDSYTDMVERAAIERRFRDGEVRVVCSVRTLTTGVDWPVSCIVDAAPTKSEMLHVQKIGRGLRINPGTEDLLVLDHAGNSLSLGLVTDIAWEGLDDGKPNAARQKPRKKLPKPCSKCTVLFTGTLCPNCGHQRQPIANVEEVEGKLVEITGSGTQPTKADKQKFYSMALWVERERNYKPGWRNFLHFERFKAWPKGLKDEPRAPDNAFLNFVKSRQIAYAKRKKAMGA